MKIPKRIPIRPVSNSCNPLTKRLIYINEIWSKYSLEQRNEMSKLLKKDGPTFKEINIFETFELAKIWERAKKAIGLQK